MFSGSITALVTPFKDDNSIDETSLIKHINWQIEQGTNGFVPVGTTGESPTLSHAEHKKVVEICIDEAKSSSSLKPARLRARIGPLERAA